MRLSKIVGLACLSIITTTAVATATISGVHLNNVFALNRGASSADYVNEFYCRTTIEGEEKFLAYDSESNTMKISTREASICEITFLSNDTIKIKNGSTFIGHNGGDNTNISTNEEYSNWTISNGQMLITDTKDKDHTLAYRTGDGYNFVKAYKASNIGNAGYYQVYFLTKDEFDAAETRCQWSDNDRRTQLFNLAYEVPESGGDTPIDPPSGDWTNVTMTAGANSSNCTVNGKTAIKCGSSSKAGVMTITLENTGKTTLKIYIAGWNGDTGKTVNVSISSGTITPTSFTVTADSNISGSGSSFTVTLSDADSVKEFTLSGYTANTTVTLTAKNASKNRFVVWGAQYQ